MPTQKVLRNRIYHPQVWNNIKNNNLLHWVYIGYPTDDILSFYKHFEWFVIILKNLSDYWNSSSCLLISIHWHNLLQCSIFGRSSKQMRVLVPILKYCTLHLLCKVNKFLVKQTLPPRFNILKRGTTNILVYYITLFDKP